MLRSVFAWMSVGACLAGDAVPVYRGYTPADSAKERTWEEKFREVPQPDNMRETMRRLSAKPHHVGSPYDKDNAEWLLAKLKAYGLDAHIETFQVLFPTPKQRAVELVAPAIGPPLPLH